SRAGPAERRLSVGADLAMGSMAVRDEFVSRARYRGGTRALGVTWQQDIEGREVCVRLHYLSVAHLRSYNLSAGVTETELRVGCLHRAQGLWALGHPLRVRLGPFANVFVHFRVQNMASAGQSVFRAYSVAGLLSLGAQGEVAGDLGHHLNWVAAASFSVLSVVVRSVDVRVSEVSPITFGGPWRALRSGWRAGLGFSPDDRLDLKLLYAGEFTRIAWRDFFLSGDDAVSVGVSWRF
ncbi:MAG: hypothetical protein ONB23_07560, partial [candidate division KSB1 bacterium]|nr:hypothetical protein [candidate division KSB1 bacterium]